ncbi:MAG: DNA polymerase I [Acidobacteriota bacterium]
MLNKILVIDGMYLIFSSFYINRNLRTLKGEPSGAIFGFVSRVESLIRDLKPENLVVAMDSKGKTFRNNIFPAYKANRDAPPEELVSQIPFVKEYLEKRGIRYIEAPGFEADDIIARISFEKKKNDKVIIFSADKDLFQLVNDKVSIYHPKLKTELSEDGVKEYFGVYPQQIVDYLSLTGDSSDNVPGVPGIGDKSAKKLLGKFENLENILNNLNEVEERYRKKIEAGLESLQLSRELVDLRKIPDMDFEIGNWTYPEVSGHGLIGFYRRFAFNSILKRMGVKEEDNGAIPGIEYNYIYDKKGLIELKRRIEKEKYFAFDLETTALDFFRSEIAGISIAFSDSGYYLPFLFPESEKDKVSFTFKDFSHELGTLFADKNIKKTGHNIKFDILHLRSKGINVEGVSDDSMVMSYLLFPNRRSHKLKELTYEFLNYKQVSFDELLGKGKDKKKISEIEIEKTGRYCIDDSVLSLMLIKKLEDRIDKNGLRKLYNTVEIPLLGALTNIEYNGIKLDMEYLRKCSSQLNEKIEIIKKEILQAAGYEINLNSSQQLGVFLFEKMGLPASKKTKKTGTYSTDIEVLDELKGYPIVKKIIDYRTYKKLHSTYLEGLIDSVDENRMVHTSYNQTVAATGRLSSSNPNLQNIPVGEQGGIVVRKGFLAKSGRFLLAADYSQIELRVMAHFSEDKNLKDAFFNDFDIHQYTADKVFGKDLFLTDQERRKRAKIINFSILYGSGPFSLSKELGVTFSEAKEFIEMYFEKYNGVRDFIDKVLKECETDLEVKTILGRIRPIPEIESANRNIRENGKRMAVNTVIQGSAADIIKVAMINIDEKIKEMKSRMVMQVHDELIFEYPPEEEKELKKIVQNEMENSMKLKVPLKVSVKKGMNWGEME